MDQRRTQRAPVARVERPVGQSQIVFSCDTECVGDHPTPSIERKGVKIDTWAERTKNFCEGRSLPCFRESVNAQGKQTDDEG